MVAPKLPASTGRLALLAASLPRSLPDREELAKGPPGTSTEPNEPPRTNTEPGTPTFTSTHEAYLHFQQHSQPQTNVFLETALAQIGGAAVSRRMAYSINGQKRKRENEIQIHHIPTYDPTRPSRIPTSFGCVGVGIVPTLALAVSRMHVPKIAH